MSKNFEQYIVLFFRIRRKNDIVLSWLYKLTVLFLGAAYRPGRHHPDRDATVSPCGRSCLRLRRAWTTASSWRTSDRERSVRPAEPAQAPEPPAPAVRRR